MAHAEQMSTAAKRPKSFFLTSYMSNCIKSYLPRRIKRMIFLASVTAIIAGDSDDRKIASKLNEVLHIAYKDDATILPMYIRKWIWKDLLKDPFIRLQNNEIPLNRLSTTNLTDEDYSVVGAFFRMMAPDWLVYGSEALISQDMKAVFKQVLSKT